MKAPKTNKLAVLKKQWEKQFLIEALEYHNYCVTDAAKDIGIDKANLNRLLRKHGLNSKERK